MRYLFLVIAAIVISGANNSKSAEITPGQSKKQEQLQPAYFSITNYQQDYTELQQKSLKVNNKVKTILNTVKKID